MKRRTDPAVVIWCALIVQALAADVWLFRKGHRLLTEVARTPIGLAGRGVVELHLDKRLGRFDPFTFAASKLTPDRRPAP